MGWGRRARDDGEVGLACFLFCDTPLDSNDDTGAGVYVFFASIQDPKSFSLATAGAAGIALLMLVALAFADAQERQYPANTSARDPAFPTILSMGANWG